MDFINKQSERVKAARTRQEDEYQSYMKQLDDREAIIKKRYESFDEKVHICNKFGNPTASGNDILTINAGGKLITVRRDKLCQIQGSRLEKLFCGRWDKKLPRDSEGNIFLNCNPKCFQLIVDYLNELAISPPDNLPKEPTFDNNYDDIMLRQYLELFGLCNFVNRDPLPTKIDSACISTSTPKSVDILHEWLDEEGEDGKLHLLYRMTRDKPVERSDPSWWPNELRSFHDNCNEQGATLSLMKTTQGIVFGGYSNTGWGDEYTEIVEFGFHRADKAFLFILSDNAGAKKMKLLDPNDPGAILCQAGYGPVFGHDLDVISSTGQYPLFMHVKFGQNYEASGVADFDNGSSFHIKEMEVYQVKKPAKSFKHTWHIETIESIGSDVNQALNGKRRALMLAEEEVSTLEQTLMEEERLVEFMSSGTTSDIIELNVSGTIMTTNRSTLQVYKDSVLARQFDKVWTDKGCSDEHAALIEHSPYCFGKILDFLRLKELNDNKFANGLWLPQVCDSERDRFRKIVDYYFPGEESKCILG